MPAVPSEPRRRRLLPTILRLFIAVVCLAFVGMQVMRELEERDNLRRQAWLETRNLVRAVSQHAADTLLLADTELSGVVDRLETYGTGPEALASLQRFVAAEVPRSQRLYSIVVCDDQGHWIVDSLPGPDPDSNSSQRDYFAYHRDHDTRESWLGPPIRSHADGRWLLTLTRRYNDAQGRFAGVVLVGMQSEFFARYYSGFNIGEHGSIALITRRGQIVARVPDNTDSAGRDVSAGETFQRAISSAGGMLEYDSILDGYHRLAAYRTVPGRPLLAVAALSENEVLAPWHRGLWLHVPLSLGVLLVLMGMGVWLRRQILSRQAFQDMLLVQARTDGLTSLANRRAFDRTLGKEWLRCAREATPLGLLLIDIDHFKAYNDTYGHQAGDTALQAVATAVGRFARRPGDLAARYGGEELALILPETGPEALARIGEEVCQAVRTLQIPHAESYTTAVLTVSVGGASRVPVPGTDDARQLLAQADEALYDAKAGGRDHAVVWRPPAGATGPSAH